MRLTISQRALIEKMLEDAISGYREHLHPDAIAHVQADFSQMLDYDFEDPRNKPVTLEEMTRRRDGWRVQWDKANRELGAALARERLLARRVEVAERGTEWDAAEIRRLNGQLAASQAEARRYAEECGRLRDASSAD